MWQVTLFSRREHRQYLTQGSRFALVRSGAEFPWRFVEGDAPSDVSQSVGIAIEGQWATVEWRGIDEPVEAALGPSYMPGSPVELQLPSLFHIADCWFEVRRATEDARELALEPLHGHATGSQTSHRDPTSGAVAPETIAGWLAAVGQIHRTAASAAEFFEVAARAALGSTGLDATMILRREGAGWQIAGSAIAQPEYGVSFDAAALRLLDAHPETRRRPPLPRDLERQTGRKQADGESIVVSPVRDDAGQVVAAVYGVRHGRALNRRRGIRPLEARVIELIADAVGAGMARREQELEAARQQVLLEQAFSPQVIDHLNRHPDALAGQSREVTILFADLRGFTSLSETMPPALVDELLGGVMETLTQCVMDHEGVIIDYYGDGLSAMWNAPLAQADHADRAAAAALDMLPRLPELNAEWGSMLARPLALGVGLHAGVAQVGNAGTRRRLKYGPRGAAVNMASRVQGAGKHLDVAIMATDGVRRRLSQRFATLRVCTARLPGLEQPVELFTLFPATDAARVRGDLERYAAALAAFERGDLDAAEEELASLLTTGPATPAAFLAQQTAALRRAATGRRATDQLGCSPDAVIDILSK